MIGGLLGLRSADRSALDVVRAYEAGGGSKLVGTGDRRPAESASRR